MKFTWDEKKRRVNLLNHGFDFVDAREVFEGITFTLEGARFNDGEERSMRKASRHEQKIYFEGLSD